MQEMQDRQFWSLGCDGLLEEGMATHSSTLAGKIPRTEKPGGLRSTGSQARHDWSGWAQPTHTQTHSSMPTPYRVYAISSLRGRVYLFQVRNFIPELTQHPGDRCMCEVMPWDAQQSLQENLLGGGRLLSTILIRASLQTAGVYWWASAAPGLTVSLDETFSLFSFTDVRTAAQSEGWLQNISPLSLRQAGTWDPLLQYCNACIWINISSS